MAYGEVNNTIVKFAAIIMASRNRNILKRIACPLNSRLLYLKSRGILYASYKPLKAITYYTAGASLLFPTFLYEGRFV
jgi:hypothetical protein